MTFQGKSSSLIEDRNEKIHNIPAFSWKASLSLFVPGWYCCSPPHERFLMPQSAFGFCYSFPSFWNPTVVWIYQHHHWCYPRHVYCSSYEYQPIVCASLRSFYHSGHPKVEQIASIWKENSIENAWDQRLQLTYFEDGVALPGRVPSVEQRHSFLRCVASSQLHCFPWFDVRHWDDRANRIKFQRLTNKYSSKWQGTNLEAPGFIFETFEAFHLGGNLFEILLHLLAQTQIQTSKICESR